MTTIPKLFLDNRVNVSDMSTSVVRISGQQINYFRINPDGTSFANQIVFNNIITPNLATTLVGKNIRLRYTVQVGTGGTLDAALAKTNGSIDAAINGVLRAYPLQSICNSITLTLNGSSSVVSQRQVLSALQRTIKPSLQEAVESEGPTQADNLAVLIPDADGRLSNQVLSPYQNSKGTTRASFLPVSYSGTATNNYVFDVCESVMVSPLTSEPNEQALPNVNTLSLQFNYANTLDMTVFGSVGGTSAPPAYPAGLTVQISNPVLELTYFSVDPSIVKIPHVYETDYSNIVFFPRTQAPISTTALQSIQVQSDTLRFTSAPSLIYVFLRPQMALRDAAVAGGVSYADFFFPLGQGTANSYPNINVTYGNRSGLLSAMSTQQAYRMSVRNGYNSCWREWLNAGCVLIINPVLDLGLAPGDTLPGATGSVNFQIQANYCNANVLMANAFAGTGDVYGGSLATELVIVTSYAGKAVITPDNAIFTTGYLSEAEIAGLLDSAPKDGSMMSDEMLKPTVQGAGLFSKMKSVLGHVARGVGAAAPIVESIAKAAQHPLLKSLAGSGVSGGIMSGASLRRR